MSYRFAILGSRGYPSTYGGFETFVRYLAPYLAAQGDSVTVYCRGAQPGMDVRGGVECVTTRGLESTSLSTLSYGATASLHAARRRFDAALVLNVANGYYLARLRRAGIPTAVNVDGLEWERAKWNRLGKAVFRRGAALTARHATEIVVDSLEIGRVWANQWQRESAYIPYGAELVDPGCDRLPELGLKPGGYLLLVARLVPENNVGLFLDVLELLKTDVPAVVVGASSKEGALVDRLKRRAATVPSFQWLGHVSDQALLEQLWANCAIYFHGHSVGGTNPALLQALGCGAPTVAVDTPFNAEVLRRPDALVRPEQTMISEMFDRLLSDDAARRELAKRGRETVAEHYRWDDVLARYRATLTKVASAHDA